MSKYIPGYHEFLKAETEKVADLIEAVKTAATQADMMKIDHFTPVATSDVLDKLHALIPDWFGNGKDKS